MGGSAGEEKCPSGVSINALNDATLPVGHVNVSIPPIEMDQDHYSSPQSGEFSLESAPILPMLPWPTPLQRDVIPSISYDLLTVDIAHPPPAKLDDRHLTRPGVAVAVSISGANVVASIDNFECPAHGTNVNAE